MSTNWLHRTRASLRNVSSQRRRRRDLALRTSGGHRRRLFLEMLEERRLLTSTLSINDPSVSEGNSGTANLNFTVTRGGDTTSNVTVAYNTSDAHPAAGAATAGPTWRSPTAARSTCRCC